MDSSTSTLILRPSLDNRKTDRENSLQLFDKTLLENQQSLPTQFLWPHEDLAYDSQDELADPPLDLAGFLNGDQQATDIAAAQIRTACLSHGFFQVINHGIDQALVRTAHQEMDAFFKLPLSKKLSMKRRPGSLCGYSGAHADRFASKLPWKETMSFTYDHANETGLDVVDYINSSLGPEFEGAG